MHPPGTAPVKAEYLLSISSVAPEPDDDGVEQSTSHVSRSNYPTRPKMTKEEKKANRGMNKGNERRNKRVRDQLDICWKVANGELCERGDKFSFTFVCTFSHDVREYLSSKPPDIHLRSPDHPVVCPVFEEFGKCRFGYRCRFLSGHLGDSSSSPGSDQLPSILVDAEKQAKSPNYAELNFVDSEFLKVVRSKKYPTPISDAYLAELEKADKKGAEDAVVLKEPDQMDNDGTLTIENRLGGDQPDMSIDTPDVPVRFVEKKRLHWTDQTYLAPLTTVGNLVFHPAVFFVIRRSQHPSVDASNYLFSHSVDCVCLMVLISPVGKVSVLSNLLNPNEGERLSEAESILLVGLATSLLQGSKEEWSLLRRHPSEKSFGIQVAGNKPSVLTPVCEIIAKECGSGIDFVDLNCGCPIDLVFKSGSGSALLDAAGRLSKSLIGMNKALGDIPVTVKLRTGVREGKNNAHKLMPRLSAECGVACLTLHGRTRQQRYSKLADWDYIKSCVAAVRGQEEQEDLPRIPIFGGGDCFSSQEYWQRTEESGVDGVMIGRGALIKPWIFTEIKERREWDISSRERLDGIRQYTEFALSHFGSDTIGVNTTRKYLCEALSFQYRYIPIGILETMPARINDRPPAFRGRDELETLLASPNSSDWVKISEMFLGPAPESWSFVPKHKSNSYESQG